MKASGNGVNDTVSGLSINCSRQPKNVPLFFHAPGKMIKSTASASSFLARRHGLRASGRRIRGAAGGEMVFENGDVFEGEWLRDKPMAGVFCYSRMETGFKAT